jgi:hypothetical protein
VVLRNRGLSRPKIPDITAKAGIQELITTNNSIRMLRYLLFIDEDDYARSMVDDDIAPSDFMGVGAYS